MFEVPLLGCPAKRSIVLQTHLGREIGNEIAVHPVPAHAVAKFERLLGKHARWRLRKPATGIYNCFGHVWASRRTAVYDKFDEAVLKVKEDDGYRVIDLNHETPECGDIACYWEEINPYNNCLHVGRVAYLKRRDGLPPVVFVLSKWDDVSGEVLHDATDHGLTIINAKLEYWTDRPEPGLARRILQ